MNSMQLKDKLKNISKKRNVDFNNLLRLYMYDRFLERLSKSKYRDNFILKGGFYISTLFGVENRATMDIDTSFRNAFFDEETVVKMIKEIIAVDVDDNANLFYLGISPIRDEDEYGGFRVTVEVKFETIKQSFHIDIATGKIKYTAPDFKVMAMYQSNNGTNYTEITTMPTSGYVINEEKTYCTTSSGNQVKGKIKTVNGIHGISGLNKGDKCYLYFDKQLTASETILANVTVNEGTPNFNQAATSNEGVYATSDGMYGGTTYYWRGAVTNNYVKFAGYCWRIIRINGDKTIRLIYDGTTCHANGTSTAESIAVINQVYNQNYNYSYYVGWTQNGTQRTNSTTATASNAKTQTENWYLTNIGTTYTSKIVDGKFCNDRNTGQMYSESWSTSWSANGTEFAYAGVDRLWNKYTPSFSCPSNDVYTLKVGLITADEVMFAGGKVNTNNASYYLYNGQQYWTMSPGYWFGEAYVFRVYTNGGFSPEKLRITNLGLRPVINLNSNVTFSSGNGTQNSPYVVN